MSSLEVRKHLVQALHADLVGPYTPWAEDDTHSHPESLKIPPSRWYLTGFLAPQAHREAPNQDEEEQLVPQSDAEPVGAADPREKEDDQAPRARNFFPASVGLSVIVQKSETPLTVRVRYANYNKREDDETKQRLHWERKVQPERVVQLRLNELRLSEKIRIDPDDDLYLQTDFKQSPSGQGEEQYYALAVFLVNCRDAPATGAKDTSYIFQVELHLEYPPGFVARYNDGASLDSDFDARLCDLQYRDRAEYAIGHGISVACDESEAGAPVTRVRSCWLPSYEVPMVTTRNEDAVETRMEVLATLQERGDIEAMLAPLCDSYGAWIRGQAAIELSDEGRIEIRDELVHRAELARKRIRAGIDALKEKPELLQVFRWANSAIARSARKRSPERYRPGTAPQWRLFQLAFLLVNLPAIADPTHRDRERVELIYFPTGGGKTEAYLGVIALHLFWRRMQGQARPDKGLGVSVFLRYTLRMLTQDQLGRAATLICAMETIRREATERLGTERFAVGMWVGAKSSPNTFKDAEERIKDLRDGRGASPCPITACPWCTTPLEQDSLSMESASIGGKKKEQVGVVISCSNYSCDFARSRSPRGIPVLFVDDQIYKEPPSFLIATVDKFAMVPWRAQAGQLFGKVKARFGEFCFGHGNTEKIPSRAANIVELPDGYRPPDLIVQDELHLISGPLGTMVGLFESAIEELCAREVQSANGTVKVLPKIVAATATVRNAPAQIQALFGRPLVSQFPPAGVNDDDNFFAHVDRSRPGRLYLGVCASGRRMKASLLRNYVALGAAAQLSYDNCAPDKCEPCDGYMTLVGYFNSIRELGGMRRLVEDQTLDLLSRASHRKPSSIPEGYPHRWSADRKIQREPVELTSRESGERITDAKRRLELPFSDKERVDVVLASNMISVGVDINRLAVMIVAGQPKTTSEYIQSSSRVGRDGRWPGLVVTVLNPYRPRDRSHYERFVSYHDSLYRHVEATSATPFSGPALDRGLASALVAMTRHGHPKLSPARGVERLDEFREVATQAVHALGAKAERQPHLDNKSKGALKREIEQRAQSLLDSWEEQVKSSVGDQGPAWVYSKLDKKKGTLSLLRTHEDWRQDCNESEAKGTFSRAELSIRQKFILPQSMRDTERNIHIWVQWSLQERDAPQTPAKPGRKGYRQKGPKLSLEGELRPSQLLSQFGPGAMVDLVDRAVVIASIDFWDYNRRDPIPVLEDERLLQRVQGIVANDLPTRRRLNGLREAPVCDQRQPSRFVGIQALEFPLWFVCQNPSCRALVKKQSHWNQSMKNGRYMHDCKDGSKSPLIPVRFVGACSRGHLQDYPWYRFVHSKAPKGHKCTGGQLRLLGGSSGDFGELRVACSCGQSRALANALMEESAMECEGKRPWLGRDMDEDCDEPLRLIVRTASNAYFPQTLSSLSIPVEKSEASTAISRTVRGEWKRLNISQVDESKLALLRSMFSDLEQALGAHSNRELVEEIKRQQQPAPDSETPLRTREYQTFLQAPKQSHASEVPDANSDFFARRPARCETKLQTLGTVILANKLRELRVLTGFSRIGAVAQNLQGEFDELNIRRAPIRHDEDWLPASEIRGEGIFFALDEERVAAWENRPAVKARAALLEKGHREKHFDPKHPEREIPQFPGVRFYMIHSLSHVLMGAIALECGYPASSIRERLYCAPASDAVPMAAILLSTGTAGAEGSLGGLVHEGNQLSRHLRRALKGAALCTHDPICAGHEPGGNHDNRHLEGAACHGCLYVAECSCERFNQYLDRALLVPTIGNDPELAFFGKDWI